MMSSCFPQSRLLRPHLLASAVSAVVMMIATTPAQAQFPAPTPHSQQAFDPAASFTSRWTRADARQIKAMSLPTTVGGNSLSHRPG